MKLSFAILLLVAVFMTGTSAQDICFFCSGLINIPKTWESAKSLLEMGCSSLGEAKDACVGLLAVSDLTTSYPNMYPHILQLKDLGCKYYCHV